MLFYLTSAMTEVVNSFPGTRSNVGNVYNAWLPEMMPVICGSERDWVQCWMKLVQPEVTEAVSEQDWVCTECFGQPWGFGCDLTHTKARAKFCCWFMRFWISLVLQLFPQADPFQYFVGSLHSFKTAVHPLHFCSECPSHSRCSRCPPSMSTRWSHCSKSKLSQEGNM